MSRANHRPLSRRWRKGFALLVSLAATCPPRVGFTDPGMMGSLGVGSMDDQFRTGAGANHGTSTGSDELPRGASGNSPAATGERLYGGPVTVTHTAAADGRVTLGSSFRNAEKLTPAGRRELAEKAESNLRTNPNDSNSVHALANIVAVQLDKGEGVKTEHVDILAAAGAADDQKTTAAGQPQSSLSRVAAIAVAYRQADSVSAEKPQLSGDQKATLSAVLNHATFFPNSDRSGTIVAFGAHLNRAPELETGGGAAPGHVALVTNDGAGPTTPVTRPGTPPTTRPTTPPTARPAPRTAARTTTPPAGRTTTPPTAPPTTGPTAPTGLQQPTQITGVTANPGIQPAGPALVPAAGGEGATRVIARPDATGLYVMIPLTSNITAPAGSISGPIQPGKVLVNFNNGLEPVQATIEHDSSNPLPTGAGVTAFRLVVPAAALPYAPGGLAFTVTGAEDHNQNVSFTGQSVVGATDARFGAAGENKTTMTTQPNNQVVTVNANGIDHGSYIDFGSHGTPITGTVQLAGGRDVAITGSVYAGSNGQKSIVFNTPANASDAAALKSTPPLSVTVEGPTGGKVTFTARPDLSTVMLTPTLRGVSTAPPAPINAAGAVRVETTLTNNEVHVPLPGGLVPTTAAGPVNIQFPNGPTISGRIQNAGGQPTLVLNPAQAPSSVVHGAVNFTVTGAAPATRGVNFSATSDVAMRGNSEDTTFSNGNQSVGLEIRSDGLRTLVPQIVVPPSLNVGPPGSTVNVVYRMEGTLDIKATGIVGNDGSFRAHPETSNEALALIQSDRISQITITPAGGAPMTFTPKTGLTALVLQRNGGPAPTQPSTQLVTRPLIRIDAVTQIDAVNRR